MFDRYRLDAMQKMEQSLDYTLNYFLTSTKYYDEDYDTAVQSLLCYLDRINTRYNRRMSSL